METDYPVHLAEAEAAHKLTLMMRREFGLSTVDACAKMRCGTLLVKFEDALSPMGRVLTRADGGTQALRTVYHILYNVNRPQMHSLVSRIVGHTVRHSALEVDPASGDFYLTFQW